MWESINPTQGATRKRETAAWPLMLGLWTPKLRHGPSSWGDALSPSVWPLELGLWTLMLQGGPLFRAMDSSFGVAPRVGVMDSHALARPLELD